MSEAEDCGCKVSVAETNHPFWGIKRDCGELVLGEFIRVDPCDDHKDNPDGRFRRKKETDV